jgi:hypothetical protein
MKDMGTVVANFVQLPPHFVQLETFLLKVSLPTESSAKVKLFIFKWDHHLEDWKWNIQKLLFVQ